MLLNDRLTDCKSHSHPAGFRREERLKHSFSYSVNGLLDAWLQLESAGLSPFDPDERSYIKIPHPVEGGFLAKLKPTFANKLPFANGFLHLTVEAVVVENLRWHPLFDPDEIEKARKRLIAYGYTPKEPS